MSTALADEFLADLARDDIHLWLDDSLLRYRAPPGAMTLARRTDLQSMRSQIVDLLRARDEAPRIEGAEAVWSPAEMQLGMIADKRARSIPVAFEWRGRVDVTAFHASLEQLQQRHSILRTRFIRQESGRIWAVTVPHLPAEVLVVDLRGRQTEEDIEASRAVQSMSELGFDLATGPAFRAAVVIAADDSAWFIFVAHHCVFDAFSSQVLIADFSAILTATLSGSAPQLQQLPLQYRDYVRTRRLSLQGAAGARTLQYWRDTLEGASTIFRLPYDRRSPVGDTTQLSMLAGNVSTAVTAQLRAVAQQCRSSLYVMTATVLSIVIARWTQSPDVAFWLSEHGRLRPELRGLIGNFVTFRPLRLDLSGDLRFSQAVRRSHSIYSRSLRHSHVTFAMLKPELDRIRAGQHYPGLLVNFLPSDMVSWSRETAQGAADYSLQGRLPENSGIAIRITVSDSPAGLRWFIEHSSHLFEEATIEQLCEDLGRALTGFAVDPELPIHAGAR